MLSIRVSIITFILTFLIVITLDTLKMRSLSVSLLDSLILSFFASIISGLSVHLLVYQRIKKLVDSLKKGQIEKDVFNNEITELSKALEESLENFKKSLEKEKHLKNTLELILYSFSHDIKTPLTLLENTIKELPVDMSLKKDPLRYVDLIKNLTDQLLKVGRIEGDLEIVRKEPVNLVELIWDACEIIKKNYKKKISFHYTNEIEIFVDPSKILEVTLNLLKNAAEYSTGTINVRISKTKNFAKVEIYSFGKKLPYDLNIKLFDIKRKSKGLGLGLFIARKYVEMHNGKIGYEWKKGKNLFYFIIPFT